MPKRMAPTINGDRVSVASLAPALFTPHTTMMATMAAISSPVRACGLTGQRRGRWELCLGLCLGRRRSWAVYGTARAVSSLT